MTTKPRRDEVGVKVAEACTCCAACDHPLARDPLDDARELEGQYGPCSACKQSISGKPIDGKPALRMLPGSKAAPLK